LNEENVHLNAIIQKTIKERDDTLAKILINEQIIEDYKLKEQELLADFNEKTKEIINQLDLKEYELVSLHRKYDRAEAILSKYASKELEIKMFLKNIKVQENVDSPQKVSNLLEENDDLVKELNTTKKRLEELEIYVHDLKEENNKLKLSMQEIRVLGVNGGSIDVSNHKTVPVLDLTKVRRPGDKPITEAGYTHKLEESIKLLSKRSKELEEENRELFQKNMQLQNANGNLLKLNTTLSQTLQEMKEQINILKSSKAVSRNQNNKSMISGGEQASRLISSPAIVKYNKQRTDAQIRNVTDYSIGKNTKDDKKCEEGGFKIVQDEPKKMLKKGKSPAIEKSEELKSTSSNPTDKEHSFGDHSNPVELNKCNAEDSFPVNLEASCKN
jgi:hypothetical protein